MSAARDRFRSEIPRYYAWRLHLAVDLIVPAAVIAFAVSRLGPLTGWEAAAFPIGVLLANAGEYVLHRYPLHRPLWPRFAYDRHAVVHHAYFTHRDMGMDSMRDLRWVLFPAFTVPGLVLLMIPIALAAGALVSANTGWMTLIVTAGYYLLYELLHTSYHLPARSWVGRRRMIRYLRRLHQTHHDPVLMDVCNFNVTFPITDALVGTWRREVRGEPVLRPAMTGATTARPPRAPDSSP